MIPCFFDSTSESSEAGNYKVVQNRLRPPNMISSEARNQYQASDKSWEPRVGTLRGSLKTETSGEWRKQI